MNEMSMSAFGIEGEFDKENALKNFRWNEKSSC